MRNTLALTLVVFSCNSCSQSSTFDKGVAAYASGHLAEANRLFTYCIRQNEQVRSALFYKGQCLSAMNNHDSLSVAVAAFGAVWLTKGATDKNNAELTWKSTYNLGDLYYRMERFPEALHYFQAADHLSPGIEGVDYNIGVSLLALKRPREATAYLRREDHRGASNAQMLSALAEAYLLSNRPDSARFFLQKVLRQHPAFAPALALQQELDSIAENRQ